MPQSLLIRLRPTTPWRVDPSVLGAGESVYPSDSLYSALCSAHAQLGTLDRWLDATARRDSAPPAVRCSSCFPFAGETLFAPPPRHLWPPPASTKVRWKGARFVPLRVISALLSGENPSEDGWIVDAASGCLLSIERRGVATGPFRQLSRNRVAVDRLTHGSAEPNSISYLQFAPGAGLWFAAAFASDADAREWRAPLLAALRLLADSGFGGLRSLGYGRCEAPEVREIHLNHLVTQRPAQQATVAPPKANLPVGPAEPPPPPPEPAIASGEPQPAPDEPVPTPSDPVQDPQEPVPTPGESETPPDLPAVPEAAPGIEVEAEAPVEASSNTAEMLDSKPGDRPAEGDAPVLPAEAGAEAGTPQDAAEPEAADSTVNSPDAETDLVVATEAELPPAAEEPEAAPATAQVTAPAPAPVARMVAPSAPRTRSWWMLSLYSPSKSLDSVEWNSGNYTLVTRSGKVESSAGWGTDKKLAKLVAEGSILESVEAPVGVAVDVAPEGFGHPVYRAGYAVAIPLRSREDK